MTRPGLGSWSALVLDPRSCGLLRAQVTYLCTFRALPHFLTTEAAATQDPQNHGTGVTSTHHSQSQRHLVQLCDLTEGIRLESRPLLTWPLPFGPMSQVEKLRLRERKWFFYRVGGGTCSRPGE